MLREGGGTDFGLHQALDLVGLGREEKLEVAAGFEGQDPQVETEDHAEDAAHNGHVAGQLDPFAGGCGEAGERDDEGDEDEDGVDDARCGIC